MTDIGTIPPSRALNAAPSEGLEAAVDVASLRAEMIHFVRDFAQFGGGKLVRCVALMIAGGFLEGMGLAMLVPILSLLAPQAGGYWQAEVVHRLQAFGLTGQLEQLGAVLIAFCLLVGVRGGVLMARDRMMFALMLGYVGQRRVRIVSDLAGARWSALARMRHARIAHILSSEIGKLDFAGGIMLQMAAAGIMLAVQGALMLILSPKVAALALGSATIGVFLLVPLSRRAGEAGRIVSRVHFRIADDAAHFLGGLKIAVAHDMTDAFVARIAAEGAAARDGRERQQRFQSRVSVASASIAALVGAVAIFGAVALGISTVTLLAALVVMGRMNAPMRALQINAQQLAGVLPAFAALRALHNDLGEARPAGPAGARRAPHGSIRFEGVGFRHPDAAAPVFSKLDLIIAPGEMVGLSGPSGTGKTTFVDLLTGLIDPDEGRIAIGDGTTAVPLGPDILGDWRRRLAYVPQDSYLINASIRDNLGWHAAPVADATLWQALARVGAADLVAGLPEGLDTRIGERGTRLSGGERQRIALARAILRMPGLLILDEATNAIDVATEQMVLANLRGALPGATILVVAHREETLRACDRIVTLVPDDGKGDRTKRATSVAPDITLRVEPRRGSHDGNDYRIDPASPSA